LELFFGEVVAIAPLQKQRYGFPPKAFSDVPLSGIAGIAYLAGELEIAAGGKSGRGPEYSTLS